MLAWVHSSSSLDLIENLSPKRRAAALRSSRPSRALPAIAMVFVVMNPAWFVQGQQLGHYIGGFTGLENGSAAPPGVYAAGFGLVEPVDSIRDAKGHTVLTPDIDVGGVILAYSLTTHKRFLGGEYGLAFMAPVLNTRFTSNVFEASVESAGLSDILFEPIYLGWTKGKTDYTVNYGFYAPSGDFDPDSPLNPLEFLRPHDLGIQWEQAGARRQAWPHLHRRIRSWPTLF